MDVRIKITLLITVKDEVKSVFTKTEKIASIVYFESINVNAHIYYDFPQHDKSQRCFSY